MKLIYISLAFILGVVIASFIPLSINLWLSLALTFLFIAVLFFLLPRLPQFSNSPLSTFHLLPFYIILLALFFFGAWRYQFAQPNLTDPFHIAFYNDRSYEILVTGTLYEAPDYRDGYTNLKINVEFVDSGSGDLPAHGLVLVRVLPNERYEYGQRVRTRGLLKTPPENEEFSYRDYLARDGVFASMSKTEVTVLPGNGGSTFFRVMYSLKNNLLKNIYLMYRDPEASLLAGILLGVDTGLTRQLQTAFKNTGTAHIIAISGFNIAIIAGLFFSIFKLIFREKWGAFFAVLAIAFYTLLVGADSAVVRAALMGSIALVARQLGRPNAGINALAAVALGMALFNPLVVWDVGFQLSFFATLGLIIYAEPFSNFTANLLSKISNHDISAFTRFINDNVVLTFAAQLTTIPIMAYHFKRISLVSFIANPFILPAQPAVMILGGLADFVSLVTFPIGQILAWIAAPFAIYTIRVVELFNRIPHGVIILQDSSIWGVIAAYAALFSLTWAWSPIVEWIRSRSASLRAAAVTLIFGALFSCSIILWQASATAGDGQLHITFLDADSASAILIQTPEGRNILINGGASVSKLSDQLGRRLPFFTGKLDWLIIAATDDTELAALPRVIERYPPDEVLWSGNMQASFSAQTLDKFFAIEEIPINRAAVGQKLEIAPNAYIEILAVGGRGSALLVEYKNFRAVLPIRLSEETYQYFRECYPTVNPEDAELQKKCDALQGAVAALKEGDTFIKADVFLLADSGYAQSNPLQMINAFNPQLTVLSVEAGDRNGLPAQSLLEALADYALLRTDRNGWISVITNGDEMRVEVERGNNAPTPTP